MDIHGATLMQFERFLKEKRLASDNRIPYYSKWVDKVLDWQLRQAEDAVRIFIVNFLKLDLSGKSDDSQRGDAPSKWNDAIEKMRNSLQTRHYSYRTEQGYLDWIRRFRSYLGTKGIDWVCGDDVKNYMAYLALQKGVSASPQNQAFNSILYFFRNVLQKDIGDMSENLRARRPTCLPVVFSQEEVGLIISQLEGTAALTVKLMYGCGFRLNECLRLRVSQFYQIETYVIYAIRAQSK